MSAWRRTADVMMALAALVVLWAAYVRWSEAPDYLLPSPVAVWSALVGLALSGELTGQVGYTLANLSAGFACGAVAGLATAFGLARAPRIERALATPILFLQTAPKIALAPLFVIWFGLGATSKIVLVASLVFFPVMVGALAGLAGVDARARDLAVLLRLTSWQTFRRIELPSALPDVFVGLRVGAVQAVVGAILGEWMSGRSGLGYLMTIATATYKTPQLFAVVLMTAALGVAVYNVVDAIERRLLAWRDEP